MPRMNYQLKTPPSIAELVDGEYVVINLDTGKYFNIIGLGAEVFEALISGVSISAIQARRHDEAFVKALNAFVAQALEEGLIAETVNASSDQLIKDIDLSVDIETLKINVYTDMQELLGLDPIHEVDSSQGWPHKV